MKKEKDKVRNVLEIDNLIDMVYRTLNWRDSVDDKGTSSAETDRL